MPLRVRAVPAGETGDAQPLVVDVVDRDDNIGGEVTLPLATGSPKRTKIVRFCPSTMTVSFG